MRLLTAYARLVLAALYQVLGDLATLVAGESHKLQVRSRFVPNSGRSASTVNTTFQIRTRSTRIEVHLWTFGFGKKFLVRMPSIESRVGRQSSTFVLQFSTDVQVPQLVRKGVDFFVVRLTFFLNGLHVSGQFGSTLGHVVADSGLRW